MAISKSVIEWFKQQIHKIISAKSSKTAIRENLDPQKFSTIRLPQTGSCNTLISG